MSGVGMVNVDLNPGGILKAIFDGIDELVTTDEEKMQLKNAASQAAIDGRLKEWAINAGLMQGQIDLNKTEAASGNPWSAGWRPAIGWVCASALFYQYLLAPLVMWAAELLGHPLPTPPTLDDMLWQLLFGMLGLGLLRTAEKIKGVA